MPLQAVSCAITIHATTSVLPHQHYHLHSLTINHRLSSHNGSRYVDDRPQAYDIDFGQGLQINASTGYTRRITRRSVDLLLTGREVWCYQAEGGTWRRFDSMAQAPIVKGYGDYTRGIGPSQIQLTFPGSPDTYTIDYAAATQTNNRTGKSRKIALRR